MYYVIQVQTGKEQKVIDDIKDHLHDKFICDVFSPYRKELRKYKGEFKEVVVRCFPGYIFVETSNIKQLFEEIYWLPEYTKILGREGLTDMFVPLDQDESRMIDILYNANSDRTTEISDIEVVEGDKIRILTGPLAGIETNIKKVNLHKRNVLVEFNLCGRSVTASVGINIVGKIRN